MGAGTPGLQRPGNDRRFPPPGVTPVPSYGWPPYKGGVAHGGGARGDASPQQPQRSTLRGQSPSPLWSRLCPGIRIGSGLARIPRVLRGKAPCGARPGRPRLARRVVAPHRRGRKWRERPHLFCRWCGTGQGEVVHPYGHTISPPLWGRSLHSDPLREGLQARFRAHGG